VRQSTGTGDKDQALLQLREIELLVGQHETNGTVSQKLVQAIQSESVQPMGLRALFESRRKHVGDKTRALYQSRDIRFLDWLAKQRPTVCFAHEVDRSAIRAFLDEIADEHSARTHNGYLRRVRSVFRSAVRDGFAAQDPTTGIAFLPEQDSVRRAFTDDELVKLLKIAKGEIELLTLIGLYSGALRLSDIVSLSWSNVDMERATIRWRMSKRRGKPMEIAMHSRLKKELGKTPVKNRRGPVLPGFHDNVDKASKAFSQTLVAAGLRKNTRAGVNRRHAERKKQRALAEAQGREYVNPQPAKREKAELDFHSLRYNFVSILKTQGCPEAIARSIMGHSSIEVSAIYTQIDADSERKWVTSLPDVVGRE